MIYLDHNATTPVLPEVLEIMLPYLRDQFGNPSSEHALGRRSRDAVDHSRDQVAAALSCQPDEILFTSGGTESNNLAIRGAVAASAADRHRVVTSCVEHPATLRPCEYLEKSGWALSLLPVQESGHVDPADLLRAIGPDVALVSVAGHKCYAPKGVGALYIRRGTALTPVLLGGGQENGLRPGTENVAGIVALGAACEIATARLSEEAGRVAGLRDDLWAALSAAVPGLTRHTKESVLPNTLNVSFPGVSGRDLLAIADGIAASIGSACHAGEEEPSAVLLAMGVTPDLARGAVRLSLGRGTSGADIGRASSDLCSAYRLLRGI